jgi:hypothetical protein
LKPEFRTDSVVEAGTARVPGKSDLLDRWAAASARPKRDVRAALLVDRPRVAVVTGVGSVAVDDIRAQLREAEADLVLEVIRVAMTRPAEVARAVVQATGANLVVLTRGGGEGVHSLDNEDLIRAVAASPVPVAVAAGHASDYRVVGRVADAAFATPTAFGGWLRGVLDEARRRARDAELLGPSQVVLDRLRALEAAVARWRLIGTVALAALAAAVAWHFLRP